MKFIILPFILLIPAGLYLYFYFLRIADFWGLNRKSKKVKALATLLSLCAVIWSANLFRLGAIVVLHMTGVALFMELLNVVIRVAFPKYKEIKNSTWNKLYRCGLVPVVITALIFGYGYYNIKNVIETDYTIHTEKTIRKQGYRIAMLSDLHFGTTMNENKLKEYCNEIEGKKPDLIILCGDIVDDKTTSSQMENAAKILGAMKSAYGTFYVYGNHDKSRHASTSSFNGAQLTEQLMRNQIHVLEDGVYQMNDEFSIIGRQDRGFSADRTRKPTAELLKGVDRRDFFLLLDHQPCELHENSSLGIDLQLSGHTHGGQLWPIGLVNDLTEIDQLNYGYDKIDQYQIIVSSGIAGWGYPLRTGSHSEFVIVDVNKQSLK